MKLSFRAAARCGYKLAELYGVPIEVGRPAREVPGADPPAH